MNIKNSKTAKGSEALVESLWGFFSESGYKVSFWLKAAAFILLLWFGALVAFAITPLNLLLNVMMWLPAAALVFAFFHLINPDVVGATLATIAAKHVPGLQKVAKPALSGATTAVRWVATIAGLQMAAAIALRVIPLHNDRTLVSLFLGAIVAIVLLSIGSSSGLARNARGLLTIAVLVMLAIFFLGGRQGIQEKAAEHATTSAPATTGAPIESATPAPPPTSGQVEHVVTPRGNGSTTGATTASTETEMPEPSRQLDQGEPEANISVLAENTPYTPQQGEQVNMLVELGVFETPAKTVVFKEKLPEGLSYATPERCAGKTECSWNIGDIVSGQNAKIEYTLNIQGAAGIYRLSRAIEADNAPPDTFIDEVQVSG